MTASRKHTGAESILYNSVKGTLITTGALAIDTWFKIKSVADTGSELPLTQEQSIFRSPKNLTDQITLALGDEVWPLDLTEICKADIELSAEMGVVESTDSCDAPYTSNLPDGYTQISGSIASMVRFDEETDATIEVTDDFLVKFVDIVEDDGEGTYTFTPKDDEDLLIMLLLNKNSTVGQVQNWWIIPAILNSLTASNPLKDVDKADYSFTKGQGPASFYKGTLVAAA